MRFYQTLAAQRRLELANEFVQIADDAAKRTRQRREKGDASEPDALQTEIQLNQVELERQQAQMSLRASWKQLAAVAGCPDLAMSDLDGELPIAAEQFDWNVVYQRLLAGSPEVHSAQAGISQARANWERQEVQAIPNVSVMVAGGHDQATDNGMMNAQIGVPLPIWNRNQGNTYAAYSEYCRATQDLERRQLSIRSRLAATARDYDSASIAMEKYQSSIVPKAEEMLNLSEQAYEAGEISYLQVLIVRRTYFESNLGLVEAQSRLAASRALLNGMLLSDGLEESTDTNADDALRDQSLSGN
jgi:cobalt-zinc-cadmium efflux system outer membrane protein